MGKIVLYSISGLIGLLALVFILEAFGVGMFAFWEPKKENIRREVFENTKSFTHGKLQDLAKYYKEYQGADEAEKETIKSVIQMQFSDFDVEKIPSYKLKEFLINQRGY